MNIFIMTEKYFFYIVVVILLWVDLNRAAVTNNIYVNNVVIRIQNPNATRELVFEQELILRKSELLVLNITNFPLDKQFAVIQVHAHQYNISLSYNQTLVPNYYKRGTNVGLIIKDNGSMYVMNHGINTDIEILIVALVYDLYVPIPGGCNMEFPTEIAPYLDVEQKNGYVVVQAAPASSSLEMPCGIKELTYNMYHYYLKSRDFTSRSYFDVIKSLLTYENIKLIATKSQARLWGPSLRRIYSSYPGTGSVYIVTTELRPGLLPSVYVPAVTYSCSTIFWENSCDVLTTPLSRVLCAGTIFLGLFLCYFGHRYFVAQMFFTGAACGALLGYILGSLTSVDFEGTVTTSFFGALCLGLAWLGLWGAVGSPLLSVLAPTLALGFLVACVIFISLPDGNFFESDLNFWPVFILLVVIVPIALFLVSHWASIISSAILGSYGVIVAIDYYLGGHLKYIIINNIRRATVKGFNQAVINLPFQMKDICLVLAWCFLAGTGIWFQWRHARGRSSFPPPPRELNERTPLISRINVLRGSDNVFLSPESSNPGCWSRCRQIQQRQ